MSQKNSLPLFITLALLVVFCPLGIDLYLPAFPQMGDSLGIQEPQLQQTVAIFLFSVGLGQLIAGPLADKLGRKPIALAGVLLYGASALLAYLAPDFETMMLARTLQGLGACATFVVAFAIVRDAFGAQQSGAMLTYLNGIVCFIPALAPLLGAWLTIEFNWRMNFLFMAGFSVAGLAITALMYQETRPEGSRYEGGLLDLRRFWPILTAPVFLFNGTIVMLAMASILMFVTLAPGWIMNELGGTVGDFTFWFTLNAVLSIIASFTMPLYIRRHSRGALKAGLAMLLIAGVLLLLLLPFKHPLALMGPMFICAVGYSLCMGAAAGKALADYAKQAGTASALIGLMQMSGAGVLVMLTQKLGLSAPEFIAMHLLTLAPFFTLLLLKKGKTFHPA